MTTRKTVFITGAGSGIGAATARWFARKGWCVGLYDLNQASVKELQCELGGRHISGYIDVRDQASIDAAFTEFSTFTHGQLHVLCNNAGLFVDCPFEDGDLDFYATMIDVNSTGVVRVAHSAFPLLRDTPGSCLINTGSAASIYGVPLEAVYSASKFFVRGLTEALALEWKKHGIRVSVIMPSFTLTPMVENGNPSWVTEFGIKLSADDIAETFWKAAHSKRQYWVLPTSTRWQYYSLRFLPLPLVRWFAARNFNGKL